MVVGGSRQKTLDPGFVLLGTRQQGVPVILRKLMLTDSSVLTSLTVKLGYTRSNPPGSTSSLKITGTPCSRVPSSMKPGSRVSCRLPPTTV
ncbi:unnamed protein product [Schistosoma margrebowiei]|uniref:Uncharacterized protein n=1 Tax=Schistosoma margrebowiei TaxID=48269 RepID=A0A183N046_9TREM|nr:unnamed protein product [Schistosoma margrebowiei]